MILHLAGAWVASGAIAGIVFLLYDGEDWRNRPDVLHYLVMIVCGAVAGPAFWLMTAAAYVREVRR